MRTIVASLKAVPMSAAPPPDDAPPIGTGANGKMTELRFGTNGWTRLLALGVVASLLHGCQTLGASDQALQTTYAAPVPLGQGTARTYLVEDAKRNPVALGVEITESALVGLPPTDTKDRLELPAAAKKMQYTFVLLDWNPHGHEPPKVYDTPHFDVHFYMIPSSAVDRIPGGADPTIIQSTYVPAGHISPGNQSVPAMGVHWVDSSAPEFNGRPFTNTFIYGASAGQLIFVEPMTTLDFLRSKADFSAEVKQPAQVQRAGWYPTRYKVQYVPERRSYRIEIGALVQREPSR